MTRYSVLVTVDATVSVKVDADSAEEALAKAMEAVETPRICHHCANQLDVGEPLEAIEAIEVDEGDES